MISTSYIGVLEKNIIKYVLELHYATKEEEGWGQFCPFQSYWSWVFKATFNNILCILCHFWLVEETKVLVIGRKPLTYHQSLTNLIIYKSTSQHEPESITQLYWWQGQNFSIFVAVACWAPSIKILCRPAIITGV